MNDTAIILAIVLLALGGGAVAFVIGYNWHSERPVEEAPEERVGLVEQQVDCFYCQTTGKTTATRVEPTLGGEPNVVQVEVTCSDCKGTGQVYVSWPEGDEEARRKALRGAGVQAENLKEEGA
jgi:hypothetical protein